MESRKGRKRPKLGLVLGGGGVAGIAHIGVLRALEAHDLAPDVIVGASSGGIIGGLYAAGVPLEELADEMKRLSSPVEMSKLLDVGVLGGGLIAGDAIREYFGSLVGADLTLADLEIPFAANAVSLDSGEEVVLREGKLVDVLRATMSLPGVFAPVEWDGKRLADGGILNKVPVNLMQGFEVDLVVAADVSSEPGSGENAMFVNTLTRDLWQAISIMSEHLTVRHLTEYAPTLLIEPVAPAEVRLLTGFDHAEATIQAGEAAVEEKLAELREAVEQAASS